MTLNIVEKEKENTKIKEIVVSFAKEFLTISEDSEEWSNEGINKFLINLASRTPNDEKINLEYNKEEYENKDANPTFKHVVELFEEFVLEYNKMLEKK